MEPPPSAIDLDVPPEAAGERLDRWLAAQLPHLSRSLIARLIESGAVQVDLPGRAGTATGKVGHGPPPTRPASGCGAADTIAAKPGLKLRGGERVRGTLTEPTPAGAPQPEPIPLRVVYEDDAVLVIDKPAGLVVHPAPGHASGTLVNAVLGLLAPESEAALDAAGEDEDAAVDPQRPGIVHRLDRDTSGLIVVARTRAAQAALQRQMAARTVLKQYLALVRGCPDTERGTIEAPIGRDPRDRKRMAVVAGGRPAVTHFRVLERRGAGQRTQEARGSAYCLVEATLETGRTHQIRVHLAAIGHPIVGDPTYGVVDPALGLQRQFLHACRLAFDHPVTGQRLTFTSPLPEDLARVLARLPAAD